MGKSYSEEHISHEKSKHRKKERPLLKIWTIPKGTAATLLYGFEKTVHFLTKGRYLPPKKGKFRKPPGLYDEYAHEMIFALHPSSLQISLDKNNNAQTGIQMSVEEYCMNAKGRHMPCWFYDCLGPSYGDNLCPDEQLCESYEFASSTEMLPSFLNLVPDKARANIGDWLTNDPSLMIVIPMIPKLVPRNKLGFILQNGKPVHLQKWSDDTKDVFLGYYLEDYDEAYPSIVKITYYKINSSFRDVDILRVAGITQHIDHSHVLPKFYGMAITEANEEYCQWTTVSKYIEPSSALPPTDLPSFLTCELIRRNVYHISRYKWFDWINFARLLMQQLEQIHEEGVIVGNLDISNVMVHYNGKQIVPSIKTFAHACYGDYSSTNIFKNSAPRAPCAGAHGCLEPAFPKHMDPSLAYEALVGPQHDIYSFGYIIKNLGLCLFIPELENVGTRIMQSRAIDRKSGGSISAPCIVSELRALTLRSAVNDVFCSPLEFYEIGRMLRSRKPLFS